MDKPRELYPFESHYLEIGGLKLHYLDEGRGEPVVMVHGNPTWSFYYRNLVATLSDGYRAIAPDHIGCGLSDKPGDDRYDYSLEQRVKDLETLVEHLNLTEPITMVLHDWGGMIGMAYAVRHPELIKRFIILNTAAFHMPSTKRFPWQLWLARTPLGVFLIRGFNAFAVAATYLCVYQPMPRDVRRAYTMPYNSWTNRIAIARFVQDIPLRQGDRNYELATRVQDNLGQFADTPMLICWGMRDFVFDRHFLRQWECYFPNAEIHRFQNAGHYVLEDAPEEIVSLTRDFLSSLRNT